MFLRIPHKLEKKLNENPTEAAKVLLLMDKYAPLLTDNKLHFFPEFTDHGVEHINGVLESVEQVITNESWEGLNSNDISILVQSILLHDLGLHINGDMFQKIISSPEIIVPDIDGKPWTQLWSEFLEEALRFQMTERISILGTQERARIPDMTNLSDVDRRLIGEFVRRNHPRLCHEISIGSDNLFYKTTELDQIIGYNLRDISGLVGRSHGMSLRDTFPVLQKRYSAGWKNPYGVKVVYLMVLIRIADYLQIQRERAPALLYKIRSFKSPFSQQEWELHNSIEYSNLAADDPERFYVHCNPKNSVSFLKIKRLLNDIQSELDLSWAVLGEVYSRTPFNRLGISYRRIDSNLFEKSDRLPFIPQKINFTSDTAVLKLLIKPLYNNDPSNGVREMIQNSLDACRERQLLEKNFTPCIALTLEKRHADYYLTIDDNGIGMSENILTNYFFCVGRSFRDSREWAKQFTNQKRDSLILRTGKFGIGALAAFLLGNEMQLTTRHYTEQRGLYFKTAYSDESIEVLRLTTAKVGTRIEIRLHDHLQDELNSALVNKVPLNWFSSYAAENPFLRIIIDDSVKGVLDGSNKYAEPNFPTETPLWRKFGTGDLDYYWTFNKEILDTVYDHNTLPVAYGRTIIHDSFLRSMNLTCNGFQVKNGYEIKTNNYPWVPPRVAILDRNGSLELSLDRNSVYNDALPNEHVFLVDICKEIVATLFALDFTIINGLHMLNEKQGSINTFSLKEHVFCHKEGYVLNTFTVLKHVNVQTLFHFWLFKDRKIDLSKVLRSKTFYRVVLAIDSDDIKAYKQEKFQKDIQRENGLKYWFSPYNYSHRAKANDTIVEFLSKELFGQIRKENKTFFKGTKMIVPQGTDAPLSSDIREIRNAPKFLDDQLIDTVAMAPMLNAFLALLVNDRSTASLLECSIIEDTEFWLFREVLLRYLGEEMIIPFNFAERKRKFGKVFDELGNRISLCRNGLA